MELGVMPDFCKQHCHYRHTMDSALESLYKIGVAPRQVTVRLAGTGWKKQSVVEQWPPPGTPLDSGTEIRLSVSGLPLFQTLPYGMREGVADAISTPEIVGLFDDSIEKFRHELDNMETIFDLREDRPETCERFIRLFRINPENWPKPLWFKLATFLPSLHRLGGTEEGVRRALWIFLELELFRMVKRTRSVGLAESEWSRLGAVFSRLGMDLILGHRIADFQGIELVLGPVTLDQYFDFTQRKSSLLRRVLELVLPFHLAEEGESFWIRWQVGEPQYMPRIGVSEKNSRLGINSHLGALSGAA